MWLTEVSILTLTLFYLLLSNAVTLKRDKSILYSRVAIIILSLTALIIYINYYIYITFLYKGIGLFVGLFYTKYNNIKPYVIRDDVIYSVLSSYFIITMFIIISISIVLNFIYYKKR